MEDRTLDRISRSRAGATSRRQALKLLGGGIAAGALGTAGLSQAATVQSTGGLTIPFTTTVAGAEDVASLLLTGFQNNGVALTAVGDVLDALGETIGTFTAGVTEAEGTCQILNLTLGPIHLDLLGLVVDVPNEIVVNITAEAGEGKLLGNLLCTVANLLNNSNSPLGALSGLLNRILGLLG